MGSSSRAGEWKRFLAAGGAAEPGGHPMECSGDNAEPIRVVDPAQPVAPCLGPRSPDVGAAGVHIMSVRDGSLMAE